MPNRRERAAARDEFLARKLAADPTMTNRDMQMCFVAWAKVNAPELALLKANPGQTAALRAEFGIFMGAGAAGKRKAYVARSTYEDACKARWLDGVTEERGFIFGPVPAGVKLNGRWEENAKRAGGTPRKSVPKHAPKSAPNPTRTSSPTNGDVLAAARALRDAGVVEMRVLPNGKIAIKRQIVRVEDVELEA